MYAEAIVYIKSRSRILNLSFSITLYCITSPQHLIKHDLKTALRFFFLKERIVKKTKTQGHCLELCLYGEEQRHYHSISPIQFAAICCYLLLANAQMW